MSVKQQRKNKHAKAWLTHVCSCIQMGIFREITICGGSEIDFDPENNKADRNKLTNIIEEPKLPKEVRQWIYNQAFKLDYEREMSDQDLLEAAQQIVIDWYGADVMDLYNCLTSHCLIVFSDHRHRLIHYPKDISPTHSLARLLC